MAQQTPPTSTPTPASPQVDELTIAFTDLWNALSLVVTASGYIDDEILQKYPNMKELYDSIRELQKSAYKFRKVIEKVARQRLGSQGSQ